MKKFFYFYLLLLTTLLCSVNAWGDDLTLTVMDDDYSNQYVPVDGYNLDGTQHNQFLLLASELSAMNGSNIKGLKFYFYNTGHSWSSSSVPSVTIKVAEVANTALSSLVTVDGSFTTVYSGSINFSFSEKEWNITFDAPYSYNGGNLLIDIQTLAYGAYVKNSGSNKMRFYTTNITGRAMKGSSAHSYCPKTTFTYEPAEVGSCAKPKTLVASSILPDGATFTWAQGGEETAYQYACVAQGETPESWTDVEGTERTLTLHGLVAGTAYDLYVRSNCGAEQSAGAKVSFTPVCAAPTAPVVSDITTTSATLSWTAASGITKYQYIVVDRDATEDWTSPTLVESTTASLTALAAGTKYDVYVRSYFNETTVSASVKVQFATPCVAMSIADFNGTFESETAGSGLMPNCWDAAASYDYTDYWTSTSTTYPCVKETYSSNTGDKCLAFHGGKNATKNIVLLPVFTEALNTLTISFYYKNGSTYGGSFSFGYYKNGVFTAYEGASNLTINTSYTQFEYIIPSVVEAEGARLAIQYAGGSYDYEAYIDDITIVATPSCAKPSGVTVSNMVYDGATIDWTENGSAEEWKLQYSTDNTNWETKNVAAHPYELRGLTTGTPYYVQVISVCGPTEESSAVAAASTFTPNYVAPTDLAVTSATTTTATISWTANSGEAAWTVQYKKSGDAGWTTVENVAANPYTIEGLTSGSSYQVKVAAGTLYTSPIELTTDCEAIAPLGYSQGFEDFATGSVASTGLLCWDELNASHSYSTYPQMYVSTNTTYVQTGSKSLYFVSSDSKYIYAILPEFTGSYAGLQLVFSHKEESASASGYITLGYMTDVTDAATFKEITATAYARAQAWNTETEDLSEVPAGARLAFRYGGASNNYYAGIDDIRIEEKPACANPSKPVVSEVTAASAVVTWTSEASEFALQYKKGEGEWQNATGTIESPYTLNGLDEQSTYTVQVKAICGVGNESEFVASDAFTTNCAEKALGYEMLFGATLDACWNNSLYGFSTQWGIYSESANYCMRYATSNNSACYGVLQTPAIVIPSDKETIARFKWQNTGATASLKVSVDGADPVDIETDLSNTTSGWVTKDISLSNYKGHSVVLYFRGEYDAAKNKYLYLDDFTVIEKPCETPTALAALATSTGATLTWTAGDEETQWNVRYSVKDADTWTLLENKTSGFAITGLEVGTTYEVQVQAYCDENHQSAWTTSAVFTPVCGAAPTALTVSARSTNAATLIWEGTESAFKLQTSLDGETWEDAVDVNAKTYELTSLAAGTTYYARVQNACGGEYATTSFTTWCGIQDAAELPLNITGFTAVPECWEINFEGEYSGISNNKIFFYGAASQMAVLPAYDMELNKLSLTFGFSTNNASLEFGYLDEPNGAFQAFATQPATGEELNLENEAAAVKYIAIRYTSTSAYASGSISSVQLRKTPTCAKPTGVTATPAVGAASIDWTSEATTWNLQYKLASSADWTEVAVTEKPYGISGLEYGVLYKVRVQAACAGEDLSDWSEEASFTTNCAAINALPYYADFTEDLSSCWTIHHESSSSYYIPVANTAMNELKMDGGKDGSSNNVVVLPAISADFTNAVLSLEYKNSAMNYAQLEVGYMNDKDDASTFQLLGEALTQVTSFTEARVALSSVPASKHLALRFAGASNNSDMTIRNLRVINQLVLADNTNNSTVLAENEGQTLDVQIGRSIVCADYFNTICLPFDLPTLAGTPLEGGELWAFKYAKVENNELLFRIIEADHIEAGVPYFISFPAGDDIVDPLFKNVTISATTGQNVGEGDAAQLCGIIDQPVTFEPNDETKLFLAANNTLYWWAGSSASQLNSFRAYFKVNTNSGANNAPRHGMKARIIKGEQVATGMENVQGENQALKLLENGQVVIIRNGVKYNIQGQVISK